MKHPTCISPSTKGWILLSSWEVPYPGNLDDNSHPFPSVFSSPYTKSSVCSFLLALPTSDHAPIAASFSSLSTLAFLSGSASIKSNDVSTNLDDQFPVSGSSLVSTYFENPSVQFVRRLKNTLRPSGNQLRCGGSGNLVLYPDATAANQPLAENASLQVLGNGYAKQIRVYTQSSLEDEPELDCPEKLQKNGSHPSAETAQSISKYLLAGAISTIVARTFVAPLERLKLEYIVGGAKHNWVQVIQGIWVAEGLGGFWKGNILNLLRMVPFKSINFLTYDMFCKEIRERQDKDEVTNFDRLTAGAASGAAATLLCFPLDTIRTRLIAPGGETLGGMLGCFHQMIRREGFLSLYKGLLPALLSMVPSGAVFYGVYDILKAAYLQSPKAQRELQRRFEAERGRDITTNGAVIVSDESSKMNPQLDLGPVRTLIYGAIAGACAETVTYPLEVVRRQLQLQQRTVKMGLIAAFQAIIEHDGLSALFAGVVPSTVQVLPSAALSYLVYESMKSLLKVS